MTHLSSDHGAVWVPCGTCWGQRRLYSTAPDGGLVPHSCPSCIGLGERLVGGDQVPAATAG